MISKITFGPTELLFTKQILNKYNVNYYRCLETGFVQTEEVYCLEDAYSSAITKLDVGLVMRNDILRTKAAKIITRHFNGSSKFLDYAGEYDLFTLIMPF